MNLENKETKYCKHCGKKILKEAVICIHCGLQVEKLESTSEKIIINNNSSNSHRCNTGYRLDKRNKWVALALCIFLGYFGAHKYYEGKNGLGALYLFTLGLFGFGVVVDIIALLFKPTRYYPN